MGRLDAAAAEPAAVRPRVVVALMARLDAERDRWALWLPVAFGVGRPIERG